jgi:pimeloyl-ACP methyl ester carboxylesterase
VAHSAGLARVIVVPGLAVHAYAELPVRHLRDNGYDARLLSPPAWRGMDHDLERYGRHLAADIDREGAPVDVLIGLSAGTQAAAVAASLTDGVKRLVLVSPTIDPAYRSMIKQSVVFAGGIRTIRRPSSARYRIGLVPESSGSSAGLHQPSPCTSKTSCRRCRLP